MATVDIQESKIVMVTLTMPDGSKHEIPLPEKTFSSGREGYYAQISSFVYKNEIYGDQVQVWKKTKIKTQNSE